MEKQKTPKEQKSSYQLKMEARLKEWDAKIEVLKAKLDTAEVHTKIEFQKQLNELRAKQKDMREKLHELKDVGEDSWEDIKDKVETTWDEIKQIFHKMLSHSK